VTRRCDSPDIIAKHLSEPEVAIRAGGYATLPDTCSSEASAYVPRSGDHKGPLPYYDGGAAAQAARSHCKGRGGRGEAWGPLRLPWGGVGPLAQPTPKCVREREGRCRDP
jgi:hypothetical protein